MDTGTSSCSCGQTSIHVLLVPEHRDFTCRCCNQMFDEAQLMYEFRDGAWMCQRCIKIIVAMDAAGESRAHDALNYMSQTVTLNRWDR